MIAILVPALGRPQQIQPLVESLAQATTLDYRVVVIASHSDRPTIKAAKQAGLKPLIADWEPDKADYAKKLNFAYEKTDEEWLFQGATDLVFYQGWDTAAMRVARQSHARVIGTNDLGNPLVKRGQHSTHTLVHRTYLAEKGGTVDDTGRFFCELYDHQWTDNEFIDTARHRREWVFSRRSVVEHMHPHWNKADLDATYEKATRATDQDVKLYLKRRGMVIRKTALEKRTKR